ncbi:shikimate dehydrogenase [Streptomyces sp. NPDC005799]|uniref:shikimate dehydrogenase n=1 Tax=Streptomyces sp. NPDC005799 TaxID=3154678 RepID=UPI0034024BC1
MATPHRAAVLGSPIAHSLSPRLHTAAYRALGLDDWSYDRFEIDEAALPGFLGGLGPEWAGLSLTMPLKRAVIPLLDEITDTAASVEAVNTVVLRPDGRKAGDNTDIPGLIAALEERGVEKVESAAILGAGATASSALAALARLCSGEVTVYVRSERRADEMRQWGSRLGVQVRPADWAEAVRALEAPLVISTTPAGGTDQLAASLPDRVGTLFDVLYDPWPTPLAAAWRDHGGQVLSGLDLLVHQAVFQFHQFTGDPRSPLAAMREAARQV